MQTGVTGGRFWHSHNETHACVYDPHVHRLVPIETLGDPADAVAAYVESVSSQEDLPTPEIRRRHWVRNLKLSLSSRCNLDCDYCFRHEGIPELTDESIAFRAIDAMVNDYGRDAPDYCVNFNLTSEPLLHAGLLERLMEYTDELQTRIGKTIYWFVLTNATVLTPETNRVMRKLLARTGRLVVSIDGPPDVHDRHRRHRNGSGTHARIMEFLQEFRQDADAIDAESVITLDYPHPWRVVEYLAELGFQKISTRPHRDHREPGAGDGHAFDPLLPGYDEMFDALASRIEAGDFRAFTTLRHDHALRPLWRLLPGFKAVNRCFWGLTHVVVDGTGALYTCDGMIGRPDASVGHLESGIDWDAFHRSVAVTRRSPCSSCWARYACGGTCYLKGVQANGDPLTVDPDECALNEYLVSKNLEILSRAQTRPSAVAGMKEALIRH